MYIIAIFQVNTTALCKTRFDGVISALRNVSRRKVVIGELLNQMFFVNKTFVSINCNTYHVSHLLKVEPRANRL